MDLTDLRLMVRTPTDLDADDPAWPNTRIDTLLNRAFWEIQNKYNFKEQEHTIRFMTIAGQAAYEIPRPYQSLIDLSIQDLYDNMHKPLNKIEVTQYEAEYNAEEAAWGKPEKYTHENCFVRLLPTPNQGVLDTVTSVVTGGWVMVLRKRTLLTDFSENQLTTSLPSNWYEIIGMGGQWRAFGELGDASRMTAYRNLQASLMNTTVPVDVKEKQTNTQYAALQPQRPSYDV